jgi:hypothetical protein
MFEPRNWTMIALSSLIAAPALWLVNVGSAMPIEGPRSGPGMNRLVRSIPLTQAALAPSGTRPPSIGSQTRGITRTFQCRDATGLRERVRRISFRSSAIRADRDRKSGQPDGQWEPEATTVKRLMAAAHEAALKR